MRACLLAKATAAFCQPTRSRSWTIQRDRRSPVALQLLGGDHSTRRIHRMNLDDALRQIDPDTCNLAHGLPLSASD